MPGDVIHVPGPCPDGLFRFVTDVTCFERRPWDAKLMTPRVRTVWHPEAEIGVDGIRRCAVCGHAWERGN